MPKYFECFLSEENGARFTDIGNATFSLGYIKRENKWNKT